MARLQPPSQSQILNGTVDVDSANYNKGDLENWIHTLAKQFGVGSNDCICILNPPGMADTSDSLASGIGGYHSSISSCRYIFVNATGTGLTVADRDLNYADSLSHEMAETIVDPVGANPEVCDSCAGNCGHVTLNLFMRDGSFVGSVTDALLPPNFDFFVEGIVQPAFVHQCPAPFAACAYFPEIWTRIGAAGYRALAAAPYVDHRLALFALGSHQDAWDLDQAQAGGSWGAWRSFGGHDLQALAVIPNADGRLEMFALGGDQHLYHLWQTNPAGVWGPWQSLGGDGLQSFHLSRDPSGALNVFAIRSSGECVHIQQVGPNGGWGAWNSLGGNGFRSVRAGVGLGGHLIVFILDAYRILYASDTPQQPVWTRVNAPLIDGFSVITGDDGALHVVAITDAGNAVHIAQSQPGVDFQPWEDLAGKDLKSISPALNADGRLEVFALGGDNKIYHRWKQTTGAWSEWAGLGLSQDITFQQVVPLRTPGGTITAFGLLSDGSPAEISQTSPNGGWA